MSQGLTGAILDSAVNYLQPATNSSITLNNNDWHVILDPAGTIATCTITMPPAPWDGQVIDIRTSQIITSLAINGNAGQSVKGYATGTLSTGGVLTALYKVSNTTWYF